MRGATHDQGMSAFGTCCNWVAFMFAIFAACSPWWTWGYYAGEPVGNNYHPYGSASVSASPFIAGYAWKTVPSYACYYCYSTYDLLPVQWSYIPPASACSNTTNSAYTLWAGVYGYCKASTPTNPVFQAPSNPINAQGLIIASCVFLFLAAVVGCADACVGEQRNALAVGATFLSFMSMLMLICAFSVWADWNWVQDVQAGPTGMPVWFNKATGNMGAVKTVQVLGPGWGCALFAFILTFFSTCLHGGSIGAQKFAPKEDIPNMPPKSAEAMPVPPAAGASAPGMSVQAV